MFPSPSAERSAGFTLLEIVVTLVIIAVVAAVSVPALLRDAQPTDMEAAADRIEALFALARDSAIASAMPVTVTIDSVSGQVWLDTPAATLPAETQPQTSRPGARTLGGGTSLGGGSTLAGERGQSRNSVTFGDSLGLPGSVHLELFKARARFVFSPSGAALGDSLRMRSSSGQAVVITVDPWNGRAQAH